MDIESNYNSYFLGLTSGSGRSAGIGGSNESHVTGGSKSGGVERYSPTSQVNSAKNINVDTNTSNRIDNTDCELHPNTKTNSQGQKLYCMG